MSLILKTTTNPYFVSMENDAKKAAAKDGVNLTVAAGKQDGDTQSQISAVDNAISRGDKGILITTNGDAVNAALNQAKQAGLFVIALDTALNPPDTADITFATDNEQAGKLDGQYAAAQLGGKPAVIAMLDLFNNQVVSVDIQRDHGFLEGMGINPGSTAQNGQEAKTGNYSGGTTTDRLPPADAGRHRRRRTAMENCLSANPNINVVYTINEPAGEGAYAALQAAGKTDRRRSTRSTAAARAQAGRQHQFASDATQYPGKMASLGVDAIAQLAKGGPKPTTPAGKSSSTPARRWSRPSRPGLTIQSPADAASPAGAS